MSERRKIYVASSWRNSHQPLIVPTLRAEGFDVYDFRNPGPNNTGFHWSEIDPKWEQWDEWSYRAALEHPIAQEGFNSDWCAMNWADTCVLVLPCGRSAHLEAGWFVGSGRELHILMRGQTEPELMYKMATSINISMHHLLMALHRTDVAPL